MASINELSILKERVKKKKHKQLKIILEDCMKNIRNEKKHKPISYHSDYAINNVNENKNEPISGANVDNISERVDETHAKVKFVDVSNHDNINERCTKKNNYNGMNIKIDSVFTLKEHNNAQDDSYGKKVNHELKDVGLKKESAALEIEMTSEVDKSAEAYVKKPHNTKPMNIEENLIDEVIQERFDCMYCTKNFPSRLLLDIHIENSKKNIIPCTICAKVIESSCMAAEHLLTHMDTHIFMYRCGKCKVPLYYYNEEALNNHLYAAHKIKTTFIEKIFVPKKLLKALLTTPIDQPNNINDTCTEKNNYNSMNIRTDSVLKEHNNAQDDSHSEKVNHEIKDDELRNNSVGLEIEMTSEVDKSAEAYVKKLHNTKPMDEENLIDKVKQERFDCTYCTKNFPSKLLLDTHIENAKKSITPCTICAEVVESSCMTAEHLLTHTDTHIFMYRCGTCSVPQYYYNEEALNKHLYAVHKIKTAYLEKIFVPKKLLKALPTTPIDHSNSNEPDKRHISGDDSEDVEEEQDLTDVDGEETQVSDPLELDERDFRDVLPDEDLRKSGRGHERGRGRGRGLGRGRGRRRKSPEVFLEQVKEAPMKRRLSSTSADLSDDEPLIKKKIRNQSTTRYTRYIRSQEECRPSTSYIDQVHELIEPEHVSAKRHSVDDWYNYVDVDLVDNNDNAASQPVMRNAAHDTACADNINDLTSRALKIEDDLNDRMLRDISHNDEDRWFLWKRKPTGFTGTRETFKGQSGPTFDASVMTPVEVFHKMFDSDFIGRICAETNRYAEQTIDFLKADNKLFRTSRLRKWSPTDSDEIISFLAILILQGVYPLPKEQDYFSFNGFGTMPYFSKVMIYNRYVLLNSLHNFVDDKTLIDKTKLGKIQPVVDYLNEKFSTLYMPSREITIEESLLNRHGRLGFAQKIKSSDGVKMFELCDTRSGYLWKCFVCDGKNTTSGQHTKDKIDRPDEVTVDQNRDSPHDLLDQSRDETIDQFDTTRPINATAKIILDLLEPLLNRGHTLIMDNYYNSPLLSRYLKRHNTDSYGTIRINRELVPDSLKALTRTDLRKGEIVARYTTDLTVMVWKDANLVSMISTYHQLRPENHDKNKRIYNKPKIVRDYNNSTGGMNKKDQSLSAHAMDRHKNIVWHRQVFRRLLNVAIYNLYVIFSHNQNITHRQFRIILAEGLLKQHRRIDLANEPQLITNKKRRNQLRLRVKKLRNIKHDHFPLKAQNERCWSCLRRCVTTWSVWKCMECNLNLCLRRCFREFHKKYFN